MRCLYSVRACYDLDMPKGVYKRSEQQLEGMRERFRAAGASTRPSPEARQRMSEERTRHGQSKRGASTPVYSRWHGMKQRCLNPDNPAYDRYGGRGINVCERWLTFENFYADMGDPQDGIDPDLLAAMCRLMEAYSEGFTLGGIVRNVDIFGAEGEPLAAQAGYIQHDNRLFRVMELTLAIVLSDMWTEAP